VRRGRLRRDLQARLEDDGGVEREGDGGEEPRAEEEEARLVEAVPVDVRRELQLLALLRRRVRRRRRRVPAIYGLSSMPAGRRQRYATPGGCSCCARLTRPPRLRTLEESGFPRRRRLGFWEEAGAEQAVGEGKMGAKRVEWRRTWRALIIQSKKVEIFRIRKRLLLPTVGAGTKA
jgi:hypothetical protein